MDDRPRGWIILLGAIIVLVILVWVRIIYDLKEVEANPVGSMKELISIERQQLEVLRDIRRGLRRCGK